MILEKQTEAHILQEGESQESIGMSLDLDSAQILMQMLSKNLYSDAIGSTIRECASNALDSHRRAGTTDPIIVSFNTNKENNYEFSVEDFGIGLDADDVKNIISKYGKSTKRNSANELGMMGLGFKAPLAYSSSFYFVARKNGMERKYMMYEGEDTNTIDLLYEAPTTERNGVKVIIPVNYCDRHSFFNKMQEQLAYFESVYFDVLGSDVLNNDFTIIRHEHFQWSPLYKDGYMHICLDNVYYPIDFKKLGIETMYLPIALRFSLTDGIFPTPNREALRYTEEAKKVILKKLGLVADYFIQRYNESVVDTENAYEAINHYGTSDKKLQMFSKTLDISRLKDFSSIQFATPKLKGIEHLDLKRLYRVKDYILQEWVLKFQLYNNRFNTISHRWNSISFYQLDSHKFYYYSDKISGMMKDYMKSITGKRDTVYFLKKEKELKLGKLRSAGGDYDNYINLLQLRNHPRSKWRVMIQEFQKIVEMLSKDFINLDEVVIPESFVQAMKARNKKPGVSISGGPKARRVKLQGEVTGKQATILERWVDNKNCKWVPTVIQMADAHKLPYLVVYGKQEDAVKMDALFKPLDKKVRFMIFSERELNNLKDIKLHNWIKMEEFVKGEHKTFRRMVTAGVINKFMEDNRSVFYKLRRMGEISVDLHDKLVALKEYHRSNFHHTGDAVYQAMVNVAVDKDLFDEPMYSTFKNVKAIFDKLPFMETMFNHLRSSGEDITMDALRDLFKYYKQRIDWKHYDIKLNEDRLAPVEDVEEITA